MDKLVQIFKREYNDALDMGFSENRAIYWALDWIETGITNVRTRFNYEEFRKAFADYYTIFETEKMVVEKERECQRIENLRKNSVVAYHPVGSIFEVKTTKGVLKIKVVEQNFCRECIFSKVTGHTQGGYFTFGCKYDYVNKNAYCSEEMRKDGKKVAYIVIE